jgi:hypothetical protein
MDKQCPIKMVGFIAALNEAPTSQAPSVVYCSSDCAWWQRNIDGGQPFCAVDKMT